MVPKKRLILTALFQIVLFSVLQAQLPGFQWVNQSGGTNTDQGYTIFSDPDGNIIVGGAFEATVDFNPGGGVKNLTSAGGFDAFMQKLDSNGNFLWAIRLGGVSTDGIYQITTDAQGNIYSTGQFYGTVDFDPGSGVFNLTSGISFNSFILKLDKNGNFLWVKQIACSSSLTAGTIALDAKGALFISGTFGGNMQYVSGTGTLNASSSGSQDIFILKTDTSGNAAWLKTIGGTSVEAALSLRLDLFGNFFITGYFSNTSDFDPGMGVSNLTSLGLNDIFVAKYRDNGNLVWVKQMGGIKEQYGVALVTDGQGAVYSTGFFQETVDFDPGTGTTSLMSAGVFDSYVQKLDSAGNFVWVKNFPGTGSAASTDITLDPMGNLYVLGYFEGECDFNPVLGNAYLTSNGNDDIFQIKMDQSGNLLWITQTGGIQADHGYSMVISPTGSIYTTGYFFLTTDFNPGTANVSLSSKGSCDIFVQKLGACTGSGSTHVISACSSFTWIDGITYTSSNSTATYTLPNSNGCDSLVTLNLTINHVSDLSTSLMNAVITANNSNATYRWLNCGNNYALIPNETGQSYTATANGSYAVEITENACTDTSSCVVVTGVGINSVVFGEGYIVYPNPGAGKFNIELQKKYPEIKVSVTDVQGKPVFAEQYKGVQNINFSIEAAPGIYILMLETTEGIATISIEKY